MYLIKIPCNCTFGILKLEQLILYLMLLSSAEVQLKIVESIFDCPEVELLQMYFRYTLNILHVKTDIIQRSYNPYQ